MKVFIVGQYKGDADSTAAWEFAGVFSTEARAIDACRDETYFVGPALLDQRLPAEKAKWPGCFYPKTA